MQAIESTFVFEVDNVKERLRAGDVVDDI